MEKFCVRPRLSGGWLTLPDVVAAGASSAGSLGFPGGLLERSALPGGGGGGGFPEDDDAAISTSGFRRRASANCARDIASFSVSMPMSTPVCFAASINWFVFAAPSAGTGISCGKGIG